MSIAFIMLLPQLIAAGIATEQQIVGLVKSFNPGMTDAEMNAVLEIVKAGAAKHLAQAQADAGK
jgi:hypothetical protein